MSFSSKYLIFILSVLLAPASAMAHQMLTMRGTFHQGACILHPDDEQRELDFKEVRLSELASSSRTKGFPIVLRLLNCNTAIAGGLRVKFSGLPDSDRQDFLSLHRPSIAAGLSIGFESQQGKFIPLGTISDKYMLGDGDNELSFMAFLSATPGKTILPGAFRSHASFTLEYE